MVPGGIASAGGGKRAKGVRTDEARRFAADEPYPLQLEGAGVDVVERLEQAGVDRQQPRARIGQQVLELRTARGDIDRDGDGAEPCAAEIDLHEFGSVGAHDGDAIAGLDARRGQRAGETRRHHPRVAQSSSSSRRRSNSRRPP